MLKAKDALVRDGIIEKVTRGRISGAGHAHLKMLQDKGERFSDWPKGEVTVTKSQDKETGSETETVKVKREAGSAGEFLEPAAYRYEERDFQAVELGTGRIRSMREACSNCRASLVVCWCETPRIVALPPMMGSVVVRVERKK